jgi:hypothetical protein
LVPTNEIAIWCGEGSLALAPNSLWAWAGQPHLLTFLVLPTKDGVLKIREVSEKGNGSSPNPNALFLHLLASNKLALIQRLSPKNGSASAKSTTFL